MRSPILFALLVCWVVPGCAQQPTVYTFEERDRVGDHVVTTSGAPALVTEKGGRSMCFIGEPDAAFLAPMTGMLNGAAVPAASNTTGKPTAPAIPASVHADFVAAVPAFVRQAAASFAEDAAFAG